MWISLGSRMQEILRYKLPQLAGRRVIANYPKICGAREANSTRQSNNRTGITNEVAGSGLYSPATKEFAVRPNFRTGVRVPSITRRTQEAARPTLPACATCVPYHDATAAHPAWSITRLLI